MNLSRIGISLLLLPTALVTSNAIAQREGPQPTQAIVTVESKAPVSLTPADLALKLNGKPAPVTAIQPLKPANIQVAILIDDGLRTSVARQLPDLQKFIQGLPAGTEVFVGYMQNGHVASTLPFTSNLVAASSGLRIPFGSAGISASPYFCLSDFAKSWPTESASYGQRSTGRKARFVLMLTNGVDPYNGSVSPSNQNSPYVETAIGDAQRAGIIVSSIYYAEAGIRGEAASFSGQSYLAQVAEGTGGASYYQGTINPVSLTPYLQHFADDIAHSELVSFAAPGGKDLLALNVKSNAKGVKLRAPRAIRPGATVVSGVR